MRQLQAVLRRPGLNRTDQALLCFALGRALDAIGSYEGAFGAYTAANLAVRASAAEAGFRYDRRAQEQFTDRLINAGRAGSNSPATPLSAPVPLFVCGMFRSGSTLAEQLLSQHPGLTAGGELELLPSMVAHDLDPFPNHSPRSRAPSLIPWRSTTLMPSRRDFPGPRRSPTSARIISCTSA